MTRRVLHLGFDGMNILLLRRFVDEGILPHFSDLLSRGSSNRLLCSIPAWTPTNWASVVTGAMPGTHGLAGWSRRERCDGWGVPRVRNEDSASMDADTIWEAASRAGLVSMATFFPASWPSRMENGYVVAPGFRYPPFAMALPEVYLMGPSVKYADSSSTASGVDPVSTNIAETGSDAPVTRLPGVKAKLTVFGRPEQDHLGEVRIESDGSLFARGDVTSSDEVRVVLGKWSDWLYSRLKDDDGSVRDVAYRIRLLDSNNEAVKFVRSEAHRIDGFTDPPELASELVERFGPFTGIFSLRPSPSNIELETVLDEYRDQGLWMAQAARYVLLSRGWDIHFCHWHLFDTINHAHVNPLDPDGPEYDVSKHEWHYEAHRKAFMVADEVLGEFMKCVNKDTFVFVNADHAMAPTHRWASLPALLKRDGLLVYESDGITPDWSRSATYLIPERGSEIFINLKGREPQGFVDPADYHQIQDRIICLLNNWKDPLNDSRIVAFALKAEDAQIIGLWGRNIGDVVFSLNRGFGWGTPREGGEIGMAWEALHGSQVPTSEKGYLTNMGCLIAAGPGVKSGYERDWKENGLMRMIDVAPTIAHVMGFEPPRQSQGTVLGDILE